MIEVLVNTNNSVIFYILANGHAECTNDLNVVCASFSFLIRTFFSVLDLENENFDVINKEKGNLEFRLNSKTFSDDKNKLCYYSNFLLRGLRDLSLEHPNSIKLVVEELNGNK